jgi:DNA polymerase-3 subunit delta'
MSVWDRLVGQEQVVEVLRRAVADAADPENPGMAMNHAWLFTGPPGAGRSTAAIAFAAALLCADGGCGTCDTCHAVLGDTHADVLRYVPSTPQISVDVVREELIPVASRLPSYGGYRVVLLEDADRLNDSSGNALLKAIEEPSPRTVWLLCSPSSVDVLPTIRSRCRVVPLRTPPWRDVARLLEEREGVDPAMAAFAARVSQGHVGRARALANDESVRLRRQEVMRIPLSLHDPASCFVVAADVVAAATEEAGAIVDLLDAKERTDLMSSVGEGATGTGISKRRIERLAGPSLKALADAQKRRRTRVVRDQLDRSMTELLSFYRDVLILQLGVVTDLVNEELRPALEQVAQTSSPETTRRRLEAIARTRIAFESNAAPQLLLESLAVELATA